MVFFYSERRNKSITSSPMIVIISVYWICESVLFLCDLKAKLCFMDHSNINQWTALINVHNMLFFWATLFAWTCLSLFFSIQAWALFSRKIWKLLLIFSSQIQFKRTWMSQRGWVQRNWAGAATSWLWCSPTNYQGI